MPLGLFRIRSFTASVIAFFLAAMGFFAAVVFLPRWFQFVLGNSATESGYQILPLLAGLIIAAVASGQIVARTGRYKALIVGALLRDGGRPLPADEPPARHAAAADLAVDGDHRARRRANLRGLHPRGAERGAGPGARHRRPAA